VSNVQVDFATSVVSFVSLIGYYSEPKTIKRSLRILVALVMNDFVL
jgi:hypothetical protein